MKRIHKETTKSIKPHVQPIMAHHRSRVGCRMLFLCSTALFLKLAPTAPCLKHQKKSFLRLNLSSIFSVSKPVIPPLSLWRFQNGFAISTQHVPAPDCALVSCRSAHSMAVPEAVRLEPQLGAAHSLHCGCPTRGVPPSQLWPVTMAMLLCRSW